VLTLLSKGANANAKDKKGKTALLAAVIAGHPKVVESLLAAGADIYVQYQNTNALMFAQSLGHTQIASMLKAAQPSEKDINLLSAAQEGNTTKIKDLLIDGAKINTKGPGGITPLYLAAACGHADTVRYLLSKGADINVKTHDGMPALLMAIFEGHSEVVEALLEGGVDASVEIDGENALKLAQRKGHTKIAELLLKKSGDT